MMGYNSNQCRRAWENENLFTRGNDVWGVTPTARRVRERQMKRQRSSRHAATSNLRCCLQGPVLRLAVVAVSLLLNPTNNMHSLQLVGGRKYTYMWIPMVPSSTRRVGMLTSRFKSPEIASAVSASNKNRHGHKNNDDDDSTWWLTHRLLSGSHQTPTAPYQSPTRSTRKWDSHSSDKKQDSNRQTEWALTRALIPRRFQHPTSGDNTPVPGKPPAWHT